MSSIKKPTYDRDTNPGFHAPAANDAPASRGMLIVIVIMFVIGGIIAVWAYNRYNEPDAITVPTSVPETEARPLNP